MFLVSLISARITMPLFITLLRALFVQPQWLRPALGAGLLAMTPLSALAQSASTEGRLAAAPALIKVYGYTEGGVAVFPGSVPSRNPHAMQRYACEACDAPPRAERSDWRTTPLYQREYAKEINAAARRYGLDPALVRAVIHAESGFKTGARSSKGARGLMQLMPATARALGVRQPHDPRENIDGGARYLAEMLLRFRNDVILAAA
ncbi:transglycosylase SLT domain-containing protein, partial [Leptospira sp. 96542]|nr:transglycosylase SLT domain-containing protein [Leptospira sp. 96542]